jgi:hypothetical protein
MSILIKPYEISAWEDVLVNGQVVERKIGVIGSNKMLFQGRAIEPTLTQDVNGSKTFSF